MIKCSTFTRLVSLCPNIISAATVGEAYKLKPFVQEASIQRDASFKKLVNTGTIDRYLSLWGIKPTKYIKNSYSTPIVTDKDLKGLSQLRLTQAES